jgi:hypothetical protein
LKTKDTIFNINVNFPDSITVQTISKESTNQLKKLNTEISQTNSELRLLREAKENKTLSNDTIFTVCATISIFTLGIIIDRLLKFRDKWKQNKSLRGFFYKHLEASELNLISPLEESYRKYGTDLTIDTGLTLTPPKVVSADFDRIKEISSNELFKAYKNHSVLSNILGELSFVQKIISELDNYHSLVLTESKLKRDFLKILLDTYFKTISELLDDQSSALFESKLWKTIKHCNQQYYDGIAGTRKLNDLKEKIISKIQSAIIESGEYIRYNNLKNLLEIGQNVLRTITELEIQTKEIKDQYLEFSEHLKVISDSIKMEKTKINTTAKNG